MASATATNPIFYNSCLLLILLLLLLAILQVSLLMKKGQAPKGKESDRPMGDPGAQVGPTPLRSLLTLLRIGAGVEMAPMAPTAPPVTWTSGRCTPR